MEISRTDLFPGVRLSIIRSDDFQMSRISVHLLTRLSRPNASLCEALPKVLAMGSFNHPSDEEIASALAPCGGTLVPGCKRFGEINDSYLAVSYAESGLLPRRISSFGTAASVLGEVLQTPRTDGGRLSAEFIEPVKAELKKRLPADPIARLLDLMCPAEPYGAPPGGTPASVERLSVGTLTPYYRNTLSSAAVEIIYSGSLSESHIIPAVRDAFSALSARAIPFSEPAKVRLKPVKKEVRIFAEPFPSEKTAAGYRMSESAGETEASVLTEVFALLGVQAVIDRIKGIAVLESSGGKEKGRELIRHAVELVASGQLDAELFNSAREASAEKFSKRLCDGLGMEEFLIKSGLTESFYDPDDLSALALNTDYNSICRIASGLHEDCVLLLGEK